MTELDLRHSLIPDELIDEMIRSMPEHQGLDMQEDRHLPKYDYMTFMDKLIGPGAAAQAQARHTGAQASAGAAAPVPGSPVKSNGVVRH